MNAKLPRKQDIRFIVAEDIRPEIMGKISLQGLMPGEQFFVAGNPPSPLPPGMPPVAFLIPSLAFVFVITGAATGKFRGLFKIVAPDKKTVIVETPAANPIEKVAGKAALFATISKPFVGPAFGTYSVRLELNGAKFSFPMGIEKGSVPK